MQEILSSSPRLPIDVLADIVDQLSQDIESLKTCSLVSRTWLYPTRVHLFKDISIVSLDDGSRFAQFLSFLRDSPTVYNFIRCLRFVSSPLHRRYASAARVSSTLLADLLGLLPLVNAVEFCGVSFAGAQYDSSPARTFHADHVTFTDVSTPGGLDTALDWTRMLSVFSSIGELHINAPFPHLHRLPPGLPSSVVNISKLKLHGVMRPGIMLEFLSTVVCSGYLTSVDATLLTPEHIVALGAFLSTSAARESIQEVHLDFSKFHADHYSTYPSVAPLAIPSLTLIWYRTWH